jgi:DNA-binding NtrC family response regulator
MVIADTDFYLDGMKKVLVIEDDNDIADVVEMILEGKYIVLIQRTGHNLAHVAAQFMPDVLLIDNGVGQKNAREMIAEIKGAQDYQLCPYILFSANQNIAQIATEIQAAAYIAKPFDLDDLHHTIEEVLSGRQKNQQGTITQLA